MGVDEIFNRHVRYIISQLPRNQPFKRHVPIVDGFGILARKIQSDGGFAEFTSKFQSLDDAETAALKAVWGADFPIMFCRFHIEKALLHQVKSKLKEYPDKEDLKTEMLEDFRSMMSSRTEAKASERMSWFSSKHEAHRTVVAYVEKQWFSKKISSSKNVMRDTCQARTRTT